MLAGRSLVLLWKTRPNLPLPLGFVVLVPVTGWLW